MTQNNDFTQTKKIFGEKIVFGDPAGARTQDPLLKRQLLYRLSYRVKYRIYNSKKIFFWQDPAGRLAARSDLIKNIF